ncbi:ABC transporter substrate-binding protein [Peptoniphilus asaccharolyticus]
MNKRFKGLVALLILTAVFLTACGGSKSANTAVEGTVLVVNNGSEPGTLDPALSQGTHESYLLNHLFTGLLRYDKEGNLAPGMAKDMPTVSEDGLTYTFTLKDDVKWSNGDPVTAKDFEFSWLRALDPETASLYAYQLYYVKGGEAYNTVERPGVYYVKDADGNDTKEVDHEVVITDADKEGLDLKGKSEDEIADAVYAKWLEAKRAEVGVKAIDDKTLEVTLEKPTPYFTDLTAFYTLYPVNQKVVEENPDWAKDASTFVSNGAFKLINWEHNSKVETAKNENWFDAAEVKLGGITWEILEDNNTAYQNFDTKKYGVLTDPPTEVLAQKISENDPVVVIGKQIGTYYYSLNMLPKDGKNPFANLKIRQAFSMALDRKSIVENITKGGQIPAEGMVPFGLIDENNKEWRDLNGNLIKEDVAEAKKLLEEGMQESGITIEDINKQVLLYNTSESHKKIAQAVQQMWNQNLGVTVGLENADFNVKLSRENAHDFDLSRGGWVGDYYDPMTMLDLFVTGGEQNYSSYSNPEFDALIKEAKNTDDQAVRMENMRKAEKILMEDMPIIPVYFYTQPYFVQENVKGVYKPLLQYPILTYAEVE